MMTSDLLMVRPDTNRKPACLLVLGPNLDEGGDLRDILLAGRPTDQAGTGREGVSCALGIDVEGGRSERKSAESRPSVLLV